MADPSPPSAIAEQRAPIVDRRYLFAFILVASLFFSWALAAALNDVLIRQFQKALDVSRTQSSFIQMAFYVGYFCAALPAGLLIRRYGYKSTILMGLALYAAGAFFFFPAAALERFSLFLLALYVIAFGLAFLETAANPYISMLGDESTGPARLNLAQSFYGVGAVLGPVIGGVFIFSGVEHTTADLALMSGAEVAAYRTAEAQAVQGPYLIIGLAVCLLAALVWATPFPKLAAHDTAAPGSRRGLAILGVKHVRWAVIAQFFYVGAQVTVWSFFIDFCKAVSPEVGEKSTAFLLSGSLAALFIGRLSGAFIQRLIPATRLLLIYALVNVVLCLVAALSGGWTAIGALWLTGFFMSIMFPTIFALGITGLKQDTNLGSSVLIMSIIGGAVLPPLVGMLSERGLGIQLAMIVPAACFLACALFAAAVPKAIAEYRNAPA